MSRSKKWRLEWSFFLGENGRRSTTRSARAVSTLQAELPGSPHRLSPLPVRTLEKVWNRG